MATKIIKPRKVLPFSFMVIFLIVAVVIIWPVSFFTLFILGVVTLLLLALFIDTYSGYLKLDNEILYRKSLLTTKSIKVSDIREVTTSGSGVFATSSLSAGFVKVGNAKNGYLSIKTSAYRREELAPLIKQLYDQLKSINPKRAADLQKVLLPLSKNNQ